MQTYRNFAYNTIAGSDTLYTRAIELTFKRHVLSSTTGPPSGGFFLGCETTNIYIYSDESGVFDKVHNQYFVFGGVLFLSKKERDENNRKYLKAEKDVRASEGISKEDEVKASNISNKTKGKLNRSLNKVHKFGIVIKQLHLSDHIFKHKKTKQRYLDWAFKIAVKRKLEELIKEQIINPEEVEHLYIFADEHNTATDGKYELRESLEEEFKHGMFSGAWMKYHPPLFPNLKSVDLDFRNSKTTPLIRAADIVANHLYFHAIKGTVRAVKTDNFHIEFHPTRTR